MIVLSPKGSAVNSQISPPMIARIDEIGDGGAQPPASRLTASISSMRATAGAIFSPEVALAALGWQRRYRR